MLVDEADTIFGPKAEGANEDLRGLFNAGHQRAGQRCATTRRAAAW